MILPPVAPVLLVFRDPPIVIAPSAVMLILPPASPLPAAVKLNRFTSSPALISIFPAAPDALLVFRLSPYTPPPAVILTLPPDSVTPAIVVDEPLFSVTVVLPPSINPACTVPSALTLSVLVPKVNVAKFDVKLLPLLNTRLYAPFGPAPDTSMGPVTVNPPDKVVLPITRVPAVIVAKSAADMLNTPTLPSDEIPIDLAPLGMRDTVPEPALTVPKKATSLAVMVIGALVLLMEVPTALVTLPVPSVVRVTPFVPEALALRVIEPLLPVVVNARVSPLTAPAVVKLPLVLTVKTPPIVDAPMETSPAPTSVIDAEPVVETVSESALVSDMLMLPDPEERVNELADTSVPPA
jgi:hypothetical protein